MKKRQFEAQRQSMESLFPADLLRVPDNPNPVVPLPVTEPSQKKAKGMNPIRASVRSFLRGVKRILPARGSTVKAQDENEMGHSHSQPASPMILKSAPVLTTASGKTSPASAFVARLGGSWKPADLEARLAYLHHILDDSFERAWREVRRGTAPMKTPSDAVREYLREIRELQAMLQDHHIQQKESLKQSSGSLRPSVTFYPATQAYHVSPKASQETQPALLPKSQSSHHLASSRSKSRSSEFISKSTQPEPEPVDESLNATLLSPAFEGIFKPAAPLSVSTFVLPIASVRFEESYREAQGSLASSSGSLALSQTTHSASRSSLPLVTREDCPVPRNHVRALASGLEPTNPVRILATDLDAVHLSPTSSRRTSVGRS